MDTPSESSPGTGSQPATPADNTSAQVTPPGAFVRALQRLLRPLVRTLLTYGVTYTYLSNLLKRLYVEVANEDFAIGGKKPTASRITLLTGVHRKDVRRLLTEPDEDHTTRGTSVGGRLVGLWMGEEQYLDAGGNPRPLPRSAAAEDGLSFDGLVEKINRKDIRPRAVLDELLHLNVVRIEADEDGDDFVHLNAEAFVPSADFDEMAYFFGRNLRDHIATCSHNMRAPANPLPERALFYDALTPESVEKLATLARERGMEVLREVNREAVRLGDEDEGHPEARQRMTLGFYFFGGRDETGSNR